MKHILSAVILSILIHLIFFYKIQDQKLQDFNEIAEIKKSTKTSLRYVQLKKIKIKQLKKKKIVKKKIIKQVKNSSKKRKKISRKSQKKVYKKVNLPLKKQAKREVIKKEKKRFLKKPSNKVEITPSFTKLNPSKFQKNTLENFLSTPMENMKELDALTQSYIKLYGKEYNSFTKVQKVFLEKSLKDIGRITQRYLQYPRVSIKTKQQGVNVVEFILYPNGDISEPKISKSSTYSALDKQTLETIKTAFKDYPKPKEATKIKIYVNYILY